VASSTSPAYTPTSSPVMIAYASVREMSRSMSYSRYFKIATPMAAGRAASPTRGTGEPIRTPSRIEKNRHRDAAGQPLQLLAALTAGTPPAEHLAGHERQADGRR
jgi:hypothetical protein